MKRFEPVTTVKALCTWTATARSVYYYRTTTGRRGRAPSTHTLTKDGQLVTNEYVVDKIRSLLSQEFIESFGYEYMTIELQNFRYVINHKKVYRLMYENGLLLNKKIASRSPRDFVRFLTIDARYPMEYLCMDIKYVWVHGDQRNYYQLTLIDVYSRKVLDYLFKASIRKKDVVDLLKRLHDRHNIRGVIIRNDNGPQFIAHLVRNFLRTAEVRQEFTHPATPEENSYIEAWHSILQRTVIDKYEFASYYDAKAVIGRFINFYNYRRPHRSIGYITPEKLWQQGQPLRPVVKHTNAGEELSRPLDALEKSKENPVLRYSLDGDRESELCLTAGLNERGENLPLNLNQNEKSVQFIGG